MQLTRQLKAWVPIQRRFQCSLTPGIRFAHFPATCPAMDRQMIDLSALPIATSAKWPISAASLWTTTIRIKSQFVFVILWNWINYFEWSIFYLKQEQQRCQADKSLERFLAELPRCVEQTSIPAYDPAILDIEPKYLA